MTINHFLEAWKSTGRDEAGYVNNPNDAGGETNWGITEAVARADGYKGAMKDLPQDRAREIAKRRYWDTMRLDDVAALSPWTAREVFDTGFLCGQGNAGKFLQQALNMFNRSNREKPDYPEVTEDGVIGPGTVYSFKLYLDVRKAQGEEVMLKALNCFQGAYFRDITKVRPPNEEFTFGWFAKRIT